MDYVCVCIARQVVCCKQICVGAHMQSRLHLARDEDKSRWPNDKPDTAVKQGGLQHKLVPR